MRGKAMIKIPFFFILGSPPPMRGKVRRYIQYVSIKRITPAYAGKRLRAGRLVQSYQDHPRLCGEKQIISPCNPTI